MEGEIDPICINHPGVLIERMTESRYGMAAEFSVFVHVFKDQNSRKSRFDGSVQILLVGNGGGD